MVGSETSFQSPKRIFMHAFSESSSRKARQPARGNSHRHNNLFTDMTLTATEHGKSAASMSLTEAAALIDTNVLLDRLKAAAAAATATLEAEAAAAAAAEVTPPPSPAGSPPHHSGCDLFGGHRCR